MILGIVAIQVFALIRFSAAFSPLSPLRSHTVVLSRGFRSLHSSQWEDDEADDILTESKRASFEEAGEGLTAEEDNDKMSQMGDFDANPAYNASDLDRVREAIKARAEEMGIEKSKVSQEENKKAEERAKEALMNKGTGGGTIGQMLDLTQISQSAPRGQDDETPAMFYNPEDEMSEEEKVEADPVGQMSIPQQVMTEISSSSWPTPFEALKEVLLLVVVISVTAVLIIKWDELLRSYYTFKGFIPRPEDIMTGSENMVLPDGWTTGMNEDDIMQFQDEVAGSVKSATGNSGFPDL